MEARSDQIYESILSRSNAFVYRCKLDAQYTMEVITGAVEQVIGYRTEDLLRNRRVAFAELICAEDVPRVDAAVEAGCAQHTNWNVDYRLRHADGSLRWVNEHGGPVFGPDGQVAWLEGIVHDIEARKQVEAQREEMTSRIQSIGDEIGGLIGQVAGTMKGLKILALNAHIESTRSAEGSQGFAAVAHEVNLVAQRTAPLTRSAGELLGRLKQALRA